MMEAMNNNSHSELNTFSRNTLFGALLFVVFSVVITVAVYRVFGEPAVAEVEAPFLLAKERLVRNDSSINTVFIGSSVTFRQIDPGVFDAAYAEASGAAALKSFNLGNPGLYPMRSVSYLSHIIDEPPPGVSLVFFELFRLDSVTYNYKSPEIMHLMSLPGFSDVVKTIRAANFPFDYKVYLVGQYLRALLFKLTGFGMLDYLGIDRELRPLDEERLSHASSGYLAKDIELMLSQDPDNVAKISAIGERFQQGGDSLEQRKRLHREKYNNEWQLRPSPYLNRLKELAVEADGKGIRVVYLLPPLLTNRGIYFAYPVYRQLPVDHRLDLSDPAVFPELYSAGNLFDLEHVNSDGALVLSRHLAEAYAAMPQATAAP